MSNRGRRAYYRGSPGRGSGRGSPASTDSSNPHSGEGIQVSGGAEHSQSVRGGGVGSRGAFYLHGGHTRGRGRGSTGNVSPELPGPQVDISAHVADDSDREAAAARHTARGPTEGGLPLRPDFGTNGTPIALHTNFFPVHTPPGPLYEYAVGMAPRMSTRPIKSRVLHLAEETAAWSQAGMRGNVAHDSNTRLVSVVQLPQPLEIAVPYYNEGEIGPPEQGGRVYTLSITIIRHIDMANLASYLAGESNFRHYNAFPEITALSTILKSIFTRFGIRIGNRYFYELTGLGGSLEAWRGFQLILKPVFNQLMVRVGISTSAFHTAGNLARAMIDSGHPLFGAQMSGLLRGVKIRTTPLRHLKIIRRVTPHTAESLSFNTSQYGRVTVADYFRRTHNISLQYHGMPLVDVGGQTPVYLPAEICNILPGQHFRGVLPSEHVAQMTATARRPPNMNRTTIVNHVRDQLALAVTRHELRSFGVTIDQDMAVVPGRILQKPGIDYSYGAALIDDRASWNLRGAKFVIGARLENWVVLVVKDGSQDEFSGSEDEALRSVVARFCNMCNVSGMHVIDDPRHVTAQLPHGRSSDPLRTVIEKINPKPTFLLVTLPNGNKAVYEDLKHLCDVSLDIATVCVQSSKFRRSNPHYLANVALKVNMKLGGINHTLDPSSGAWLNSAPTMIVGIHVTHPGPGSAVGTPSVVAVVASVDDDFAHYPAKLEIQGTRPEVLRLFEQEHLLIYSHKLVSNLKSIMVDRLKLFQAENKKLPERIIIYRSGVSESHSDHVRTMELPQIRDAFNTFRSDKPYKPKIAIIFCGKRNQARFYPTVVNGSGSVGNPPPGTVVDRGITSIYNFDFFLQSHDASSGTARPMHYYVVHDEIDFRADELQRVTNSLSYMFARATKSVRLASPAAYAELASKRGRCYLRKLYLGQVTDSAEQDVMQEAQVLWGGGVSGASLKNTMFYL